MIKFFRLIALILIAATGASMPQARAQETFRRNLEQVTFVPKGQWLAGVSVNYAQNSSDKYQFLIIEDISGDAYSFKVSPMVQYCFKNNMTAGGRLSYERLKTTVDRASLVLSSEDAYDVDNFDMVTANYYATALYRNYFSLGAGTRFGFFNELQLQLGGGESRLINGAGEDLTGTFERNFSLNVGLSPGLIMFLNNYSAIEVNVGVLGFGYTKTKSTTDRVYIANRKSQKANFKVNLFSIQFGVVFYL